MSTRLERIQNEKFLLISIIVIVIANLLSNVIGEETAILVGNFVYFPTAGGLVFVSVLLLKRLGSTGKHGTAWISLFGFSVMWFVAEMVWTAEELFLNIEPYPSAADIFYLMGYPFLLLFLISYLEPIKNAITKKVLIIPIIISLSVLIPSLYFAFYDVMDIGNLDYTIAAAYPVADSFVIVPALIGIHLFFRGQVNFMWSLVCIGIISVFIADTAFLFAQVEHWYYTGHPMEILFHFTYVLMAFGAYDQIRIFKKNSH
ncbi:MAG: hypothetical protein ACE5R3_02040 [Nitrosopumilaceae archaeon]